MTNRKNTLEGETAYLLKSPKNAERLLKAIEADKAKELSSKKYANKNEKTK